MEVEKKKLQNRKRVLYFDILNIIACFGVVVLHCSDTVFSYRLDRTWVFALFVQTCFYWTVPVFVMLSGATLLNYREKYSTKEFFKRRVTRIVFPFLFWSTVLLIWKLYTGELIWENWKTTVTWYLGNGIESIYWFFYPLFGMYLIMPVLSMLVGKEAKRILQYILVVSLVYNCVIAYLPEHFHIYYNTALFSPLTDGFLGYIVMGWILSREEIGKRIRYVIYTIGILSSLAMFGVTFYNTWKTGTLDTTFFNSTGCTAYGQAAAIFVWCRYFQWDRFFKGDKARKMLLTISGASFGIYLIQMRFIYPWIWNKPENARILMMTFGALGIYLLCLIIVLFVKKIPVLRKVFP